MAAPCHVNVVCVFAMQPMLGVPAFQALERGWRSIPVICQLLTHLLSSGRYGGVKTDASYRRAVGLALGAG